MKVKDLITLVEQTLNESSGTFVLKATNEKDSYANVDKLRDVLGDIHVADDEIKLRQKVLANLRMETFGDGAISINGKVLEVGNSIEFSLTDVAVNNKKIKDQLKKSFKQHQQELIDAEE